MLVANYTYIYQLLQMNVSSLCLNQRDAAANEKTLAMPHLRVLDNGVPVCNVDLCTRQRHCVAKALLEAFKF